MFRVIRRACVATLLLLLLTGCGTTRIVPPPDPRDPVSVFVLDHGRHTSLVLPAPDGSLRRYAYGDWRYYAERDTSTASGLAALLWSTQGALGYRVLPGPATAEAVRSQVRVVIVELHSLNVERERVERLRRRLDARIAEAEHHLKTPEVDLTFIPYPTGYHLGHNSNQLLADWLVELGCEVSRRPVRAGWRVETAR
ncbi:MAG TPA: hypothetical protein VIQ75_01025 [Gammaproteobacteria bacterium]